MIHQILLTLLGSAMGLSLEATAAPSTPSQTQLFFSRQQTVRQDDLVEHLKDKATLELERKISEKISEYGLREMTAREHGISQAEYLNRKSRSQFGVIYFDVQAKKDFFGRITFNLVYAKGSDFFIEDEKNTVIEGCQALEDKLEIRIHLERCLQKHFKG